ncbi:hypothetical protein, partial [Streptomyces sp. JV190]|uniref:hypothetical protein n=1 Tax=Streptomyces sp. JV190 TaxID=3002533 RepID=UPI002E780255
EQTAQQVRDAVSGLQEQAEAEIAGLRSTAEHVAERTKSDTGATRPGRTTYFCVLVPDVAARTTAPTTAPGTTARSPPAEA